MTFDKLKQLISQVANVPVDDIHEHASFKDDLGIDSLQMVNLIIEVSKAFGVGLAKFQSNEDLATVGSFFIAITKE